MIKEKTNRPKDKNDKELSGINLMRHVFNPKNPLLRWNTLKTDVEKNEYEGYGHIFAGSVQGIRNPKAHSLFEQTPRRAFARGRVKQMV
jgi:uncharacterized protein (TIGR02391 family)